MKVICPCNAQGTKSIQCFYWRVYMCTSTFSELFSGGSEAVSSAFNSVSGSSSYAESKHKARPICRLFQCMFTAFKGQDNSKQEVQTGNDKQ